MGGSEEILGKITEELHNIADSFTLSPEERTLRLQQLADNSIRLIREEQELSAKESELFGLNVPNQAWRDEIRAAETFWLSAPAIEGCIATYLRIGPAVTPSTSWGTNLSSSLRLNQKTRGCLLEDYKRLPRSNDVVSREWEKWLKGSLPTLPVTFQQEMAAENPKEVYLSVVHPLVRQAARFLEITEPVYAARLRRATRSRPVHASSHCTDGRRMGSNRTSHWSRWRTTSRSNRRCSPCSKRPGMAGQPPLPTAAECDALDSRHHLKWREVRLGM